uniref:IST1 homolog n=1 Tax=Loxodonta africana TaxID=9785 RepID=G3U0Z3_LOXAF
MFSSGFKADCLQVHLQLVASHLKLPEKKKTRISKQAQKKIPYYLAAGKDERARIQVEHIIREDFLLEAMEILELFCDLLLAWFTLIQATKELDSGLAESVSTLIWGALLLQAEVPELKIISNQLCAKYSQECAQLCRTYEIGTVSSWLMCKLNMDTLPQALVEQYLIQIAKNYNVPYKSTITAEAPADLVSTEFTEDLKKDALGRGGGTVAGTGDLPGALLIAAPGLLPVPSAACSIFIPKKKDFLGSCTKPQVTEEARRVITPLISRKHKKTKQNSSKQEGNLTVIKLTLVNYKSGLYGKSESRTKIGFDKFMLPDLPHVELQASSSIDPYDSEEVDFEDLNRRLEMLRKKK